MSCYGAIGDKGIQHLLFLSFAYLESLKSWIAAISSATQRPWARQTGKFEMLDKYRMEGEEDGRVIELICCHNLQSSLKGLEMGGLSIVSIQDVTPIPHNGCRPKKARRL